MGQDSLGAKYCSKCNNAVPDDSSNNVNPFKSISFAFFQISNVQKNNKHPKQKTLFFCYPMQKTEDICKKI